MKAIRLSDGVEVEATQLKMCSSRSYRKVRGFLGDIFVWKNDMPNGLPGMKTADGVIEIADNDFVVKDVNGNCSVCSSDKFANDYIVFVRGSDLKVNILKAIGTNPGDANVYCIVDGKIQGKGLG